MMKVEYVVRRCQVCFQMARWYDDKCPVCEQRRIERARSIIIAAASALAFACAIYLLWIRSLP